MHVASAPLLLQRLDSQAEGDVWLCPTSLHQPGQDVCDQSAARHRLLPQRVLLVQCKRVAALLQAELLLDPADHLTKRRGTRADSYTSSKATGLFSAGSWSLTKSHWEKLGSFARASLDWRQTSLAVVCELMYSWQEPGPG